MPTNTNPTPGPLTDESESWKRTMSILAALDQVAREIREEARQIEVAYPNRMSKPGYIERVEIVSVLSNTYDFMNADIRAIARTCGLTMPEGLK
ncbi:hypothetical protein LCM27_06610 [Ruegeria marisrubri]|uniref:hypothetical protein n=1 Tax=Ruegeria marisrubri TaxID=1685379 RepID=UPI001CD2ECEF|nr:hypothetical protein [Ruegeria marisrubri]MCA0906066.1 hypothetical protein [Ruegeria marisrubri]